jgi:hypothetical protein
MDAGDWIAVTALAVSGVSVVVASRSARYERASAEAAKRSAEAAERANLLAQELAAGRDKGPTGSVAWKVERRSKYGYLLRNTGDVVAEGVNINAALIGAEARNLPEDAVVRPGASAEFLLIPLWGRPLPAEVWVSWCGPGGPADQAVPLPPG